MLIMFAIIKRINLGKRFFSLFYKNFLNKKRIIINNLLIFTEPNENPNRNNSNQKNGIDFKNGIMIKQIEAIIEFKNKR